MGGSSDCWWVLCIIVGSLPYNRKHIEDTDNVIWYFMNKVMYYLKGNKL